MTVSASDEGYLTASNQQTLIAPSLVDGLPQKAADLRAQEANLSRRSEEMSSAEYRPERQSAVETIPGKPTIEIESEFVNRIDNFFLAPQPVQSNRSGSHGGPGSREGKGPINHPRKF